jgi:hypothetical protein
VPFKDGRPDGYYENFGTGFWASGERRAEVWGNAGLTARCRGYRLASRRHIDGDRHGLPATAE